MTELENTLQAIKDAITVTTVTEEEATVDDEAVAEESAPAPLPLTEEDRHALQLRVTEAVLFAASQPLDEKTIEMHLARGPAGEGADVTSLLLELQEGLRGRGVQLFEIAGKWALRTAPELADYLKTETTKPVKLSRAMSEVLAIVAYHQPVTRAEIEAIRGVATSKGTLDFLMEVGWVRPGHRLETPGRPLTWITTPAFLDHFGLSGLGDLPGMDELKAAGLLESKMATTYGVIAPSEAELPPAIEGETLDPDFLPSEETKAEAAEEAEQAEDDDLVDEVEADENFDDEDDELVDEDDDDFEDEDEADADDTAEAEELEDTPVKDEVA
jgi:segregation and condensation protein B